MSLRMSQVVSDVMNDLLDELEVTVAHPDRIIRLFNKIQLDLAVELECCAQEWEHTLPGYSSEKGLTAATSTDTDTVVHGSMTGAADDYYNGWILQNETRKATAPIIDSAYSDPNNTLELGKAIASQAAGDSFYVERWARYVDMHWSVIRPKQYNSVFWGDYELDPTTLSGIKDYYRNSGDGTGTPGYWAQDGQRLWLCPQPSTLDIVRIDGYRRPAECLVQTTTNGGWANGGTIVCTDLPTKPDNYYVGSEVELLDGVSQGEVRKISQSSGSTLTVETLFSAQVASGVSFEILSPLSAEFQEAIEQYLRWKILFREKEFVHLAREAQSNYEEAVDNVRNLTLRKNTAFTRLGPVRPRIPQRTYKVTID